MESFDEIIEQLPPSSKSTPHLSNMLEKLKKEKSNNSSNSFLLDALKIYCNNIKKFRESPHELNNDLQYIKDTDAYISFLRSNNQYFSHQSDMISSVIPELFCQMFEKKLSALDARDFHVSGQEDLKIDFQIIPNAKDPLTFKSKRVDVCVYKVLNLTINDINIEIPIPIISIENKVNLDKNMIYGIINTSSSVKRMFPESKFFVYTEFSDLQLDKHNFAYSNIDEIYTLRMQKRASYRSTNKANQIHAKLVIDSIDALEEIVKENLTANLTLEEKMYKSGRLIKP